MSVAEFEDFLNATKDMTTVHHAGTLCIDISLIDENLRLSSTQKIRHNDIALNQAEFLQA